MFKIFLAAAYTAYTAYIFSENQLKAPVPWKTKEPLAIEPFWSVIFACVHIALPLMSAVVEPWSVNFTA